MSRTPGFRGVYAVAWSQIELGGERALPPECMALGMTWSWRGRARRLDADLETLWLDRPLQPADPRGRARSRMMRLALSPAQPPGAAALPDEHAAETALTPDSFALTDGERLYPARLLRRPGRVLAVFDPLMPPAGRPLWVCALDLAPQPARAQSGAQTGVICFLPGTRIATPGGTCPVEQLSPGARVLTRDNGPQPVIWCGATQLSGAELYLHPHLRPIRIRAGALGCGQPDADLLVSPGHRLLLRRAEALFGTPEVLAAAADLEDGHAIRRDFAPAAVSYVHLMLPRHEIITANGTACESFHPGLADPGVLKRHASGLERAAPGVAGDPARFGPPARRCLSRAETRILLHATA